MTVKELKRALSKAPDNAEVVMADLESVVFAEMSDEWFVISDRTDDKDEDE